MRPGEVAAEYVAGHRARYVPPIRLYIFASFVMFLVLSLTGGSVVVETDGAASPETAMVPADRGAPGAGVAADSAPVAAAPDSGPAGPEGESGSLADRLGRGLTRLSENPEDFGNVMLNRVAQSMFLLLPAFALILKVLHPHRLYVQHLVFAVYLHSVAFLLIAAAELIGATGVPGSALVGGVAMVPVPAHLVMGMRRFYGQRWPLTLRKAAIVMVGYGMVVASTMAALIAVSLLLLGGG